MHGLFGLLDIQQKRNSARVVQRSFVLYTNMNKNIISIALLLCAIVCFRQAGRLHRPLLELRSANRLNQAPPLENAPPLVSFTTIALGGFRGIIADILWVRAARLQQEGKYFELVQLSDWITKLEPRFAAVWGFHAWNLAYNVSVMFTRPEDRWRWIKHGISMLRDQGLVYNPGSPELYHELSWLFAHKIGSTHDAAHAYYKQQWAHEMEQLLSGPRPDYTQWAASMPDRLKDQYKLEPEVIREIEATYGPLDWRSPYPHAVYWAWQGKSYAVGFSAVRLNRLIFQAFITAFTRGRFVIHPTTQEAIPASDPSQIRPALNAFEQAIHEHPGEETFKTAHQTFLRQAILELFVLQRTQEAEQLYTILTRLYPSVNPDNHLADLLYQIVMTNMKESTEVQRNKRIEELRQQSTLWVEWGDKTRAEGYQKLAQLCEERAQKHGFNSIPASAPTE